MRHHRLLAAAVGLCLLAPTLALAQSAPRDPDEYADYIAPYIGVNFGGDLFKEGAYEKFGKDNPRALGLAVGFWGKGMISGELDFCYNPEFFGPKDVVSNNDLMTVTASFVINPTIDFGSQRVRPYFLVGGGLMRSKIEDFKILGKDVKNQGVVDVGGGVQYYFHPRIGVRADLRYFMGVGADDSKESGWGWIDKWNYFRATLGIAFTF